MLHWIKSVFLVVVCLGMLLPGNVQAQTDSMKIDSTIQFLTGEWEFYAMLTGHSTVWLYPDYWGYEQKVQFFQTHQDSLDQTMTFWFFHDDHVVDIGTVPLEMDPSWGETVLLRANVVNEEYWDPNHSLGWTYITIHPDTIRIYGFGVADGASRFYSRVKNHTSNQDVHPKDQQVTLFPNPTSNNLNVQIKGHSRGNENRLRLVDLTGKLVREASFSGDFYQLKRAQLPAGIYILSLETPVESISRKVVFE